MAREKGRIVAIFPAEERLFFRPESRLAEEAVLFDLRVLLAVVLRVDLFSRFDVIHLVRFDP